MGKKINSQDLIKKIEKMTRERMSQGSVVDLASFRDFKKKQTEPPVILVIEDDETMRAALIRILESESYVVKAASDATELSSQLSELAPDLMIVDVGLPWLNGFELGQMLKEHAELKNIPLVFISGKATTDDIKRGFELGADDFIKKPFEIDHLKKTVKALLKISA